MDKQNSKSIKHIDKRKVEDRWKTDGRQIEDRQKTDSRQKKKVKKNISGMIIGLKNRTNGTKFWNSLILGG